MLRLKKVAVTGGLSCGKSSVCRILKELGAYVISADEIVHHLLSSDANLGRDVVNLLGRRILIGKQIDRARIAEIVFQEPNLLQDLENILHPAVYEEIEKEYQNQQNKEISPKIFIAEIPLLFESRRERDFDTTIAVVSDPKICFERFQAKSNGTKEQYEYRVARQLPMLEKAVRADYVIMNSSSLQHLKEITKELYQELITYQNQ